MSEKKLQSEIVKDFRKVFPQLRGCLWSTPNRTLNLKDGMTQKAMGLHAGVSDLCLFISNRFIGIEVKYPNKKHKRGHIEQQLEWGKKITENGGEWYIITNMDAFWDVFHNNIHENESIYTINDVEKIISGGKSSICFR